jgi:hypothetical protein
MKITGPQMDAKLNSTKYLKNTFFVLIPSGVQSLKKVQKGLWKQVLQ